MYVSLRGGCTEPRKIVQVRPAGKRTLRACPPRSCPDAFAGSMSNNAPVNSKVKAESLRLIIFRHIEFQQSFMRLRVVDVQTIEEAGGHLQLCQPLFYVRRINVCAYHRVIEARTKPADVAAVACAGATAPRKLTWPRREKLIDSPRMRTASCGAWKPIEFSASMKSR
jgi:hypothetical protein